MLGSEMNKKVAFEKKKNKVHASDVQKCVQVYYHQFIIFGLHRMHEMLTILTDVCGVCLSVCHAA